MDYLDFLRTVGITATTAKTIATAVIALVTLLGLYFTLVKQLFEFRQRDKLRCRADADFALKMAEQTGDEHFKQMGVQLGMAGLMGGAQVSHAQRQVLMATGDPFHWDQRYQPCAHYVQIAPDGDATFGWRPAYASSSKRCWSKVGHFALSFWLAFLASLGIAEMSMGAQTVNVFVAWPFVVLLLVTSFLVMLHLTKLSESEALIAEATERAQKDAALASTPQTP